MNTQRVVTTVGLMLAFGCAGTHAAPTRQLADVQAANRTASELGAQNNPKAKLHLTLAEEQLSQAKQAMEDDDDETAERLLMRAQMDAELAIALTREADAMANEAKVLDAARVGQSASPELEATP